MTEDDAGLKAEVSLKTALVNRDNLTQGRAQDEITAGNPAGRGFVGTNRVNPSHGLFFFVKSGAMVGLRSSL